MSMRRFNSCSHKTHTTGTKCTTTHSEAHASRFASSLTCGKWKRTKLGHVGDLVVRHPRPVDGDGVLGQAMRLSVGGGAEGLVGLTI